jgi:hypothetical protein
MILPALGRRYKFELKMEPGHPPRRNFFILTNARMTAGKYMAARIPMMAMTHSNSVNVKPFRFMTPWFI